MNIIAIDTNILLRWLVDEDMWPSDNLAQSEAVERLLLDDTKTIFVNTVVVYETIWLLHRRAKQPKSIILEILERLLLSSNVRLQHRAAFENARNVYASSNCEFYDCLIAEINHLEGCATTFTFDKAASKTRGFTLLTSDSSEQK